VIAPFVEVVSILYASNRCDIAIYQYSQGHEIAYVEAYKMLASIIDKEKPHPLKISTPCVSSQPSSHLCLSAYTQQAKKQNAKRKSLPCL
jgi:hypothetical protein